MTYLKSEVNRHCKLCVSCNNELDEELQKAKQEVFDDLEHSELYREVIQYTEWYSEMKEKHLHPITDKETSNQDHRKVKSV